MGTCHIVGAGDFSPFIPEPGDIVIAADGGFDHLLSGGIECNVVIGDMDSVACIPTGVRLVRHPVRKDETDMQLCYEEGRRLGFRSFAIHGGTGGRPDHTFANYSLLLRIAEDGGRATLYSEKYLATVIKNTSITLRGKWGNHLSVFAFGGNAEGVSVLGAEYEARDVTLTPDFPLGVSNSFKDGDAVISVSSGALLVMWEK